jgi:uncharacterized protein YjbI with pentapeptide repeats
MPIRINNAVIEGSLDLRYATFNCEISITNSEFLGDVDFSFAIFDRKATFDGSLFLHSITFRGARAKGDLEFVGARFSDCPKSDELHEDSVFRADFQDLKVDYVFRADGARFGCANFRRAVFSKSVLFRPGMHKHEGEADEGPTPTCFAGEVDFSDAYMKGPVLLNGADFEQKAVFSRVHITSIADFSCYSDAEYFICTRFRGQARFVGAQLDSHALFRGTCFEEDAIFDGIKIGGALHFQCYDLGKSNKTQRLRNPGEDFQNIKGIAPQWLPACFSKSASFIGMRVESSVSFVGAEFQGNVTFELMRVEGHALFRSVYENNQFARTMFNQQANFLHARVRGNAEFDGARFVGLAIFDLLNSSNILFRAFKCGEEKPLPTDFSGKASFVGMEIESEAHFSGVCFNDEVSFEGMHVHGKANFDSFIHEVEIDPADYQPCDPVRFSRLANFNNSHFKHDVNFERASFLQTADFTRAITEGEASFRGAEFLGDVSLNNARFVTVLFGEWAPASVKLVQAGDKKQPQISDANGASQTASDVWLAIGELPKRIGSFLLALWKRRTDHRTKPQRQFHGKLDLRGFTYDRMKVDLDELLDGRIFPYDRHPYAQLESVYRKLGDEEGIDKIYRSLRNCERQIIKKRLTVDMQNLKLWKALRGGPSWFLDYVYWRSTGYGTLPLRLLLISGVFLWAGTAMFAQRGAVQYRDKVDELIRPRPDRLDAWEAFGLSLNEFIPIIEITSGDKWKPSDELIPYVNPIPKLGSHITYATYGTVHRLAGGVLVSAGLAALTLTLYRRGKATS